MEDREAQIANITEDIRNGNTGYLSDFLNALISDSIREGMTDIFGKGTELDDSEGVQTARKAKELLDRLAEYKPLAKVEELEVPFSGTSLSALSFCSMTAFFSASFSFMEILPAFLLLASHCSGRYQ